MALKGNVLELIIDQPATLDDAQGKFAAKAYYRGYMVEGDIVAHWQDNLFKTCPDAIVRSKVRKRSNYIGEED